jgi:hypothetical protein
MIGRQALASVLVVLVVVSSVAGVGVAGLAGASSSAPAGFESVPDQATSNDVPTSQSLPGAAELTDSVAVNRSAETTSVSVTTEAAAQGVVSECSGVDQVEPAFCSEPRLTLNISDDQRHQGREVAVPRQALVDAVGEVPETVNGVNNETGEQWSATTSVKDGYVVFTVPHFSTNTVTFSGEVRLTAAPAEDGSQLDYSLDSADNVGNFTVELTGSRHAVWENISMPEATNGATTSTTVAGTTAATGPGTNGDPVLRMTSTIPDQRWAVSPSGETMTSAVIDGAYVYTQDATGTVRRHYRSNGSVDWRASYAAAGDDLEVGTNNVFASMHEPDQIVKLDKATGAEQWASATTPNPYELEWNGSHVHYGGSGNNNVHVLDSTGTKVDEWSPGSSAIYKMDMSGSRIFVGLKSGEVAEYSAGGVHQWSKLLDDSVIALKFDGTYVYAGESSGSADGSLVKIDGTGAEQWATNYGPDVRVRSVAFDGSDYFIGLSNNEVKRIDPSNGAVQWTFAKSTNAVRGLSADDTGVFAGGEDNYLRRVTYRSEDPAVALDGTTELSQTGRFGNGSVKSTEVSLPTGSHTLDVSTSAGTVDINLDYRELTESVDPSLEINGHWSNHTGTLADGSTTSLTVDPAWLRDGTNRVNVSVAPSVSSDAPAPEVGIDYQHDADDLQNISFASEQWTERYNVSKTYASDRRNAYLNISHPSNVVSVRDLEVRWNESGGWSSVASSNYQLTGNDLSVDLSAIYPSGSTIPATSTVEVRLNASKVQPHNMTIEVLEASDANSELYSKIRFESLGANAHLDVGPTDEGSRVHHLLDESWSAPSEYVVIDASGAQKLYVPGATAGDTARVTNISAAVNITDATGDVQVGVESGGEEPTLDISPGPGGSGDSIEIAYYRTTSGYEYALYSLTNDVVRATDTANSPVFLSDDDSDELLEITLESTGGSGGSGDGGGGGPGQFAREATSGVPLPLLALGLLGALGVLYLGASRFRSGSSGSSRRSTGVASGIASSLQSPLTLGAIGAVVILGLVITGQLTLPRGGGILILVAGIPLIAYVSLRSLDQYSTTGFLTISAIVTLVGLQLLGGGIVDRLLDLLGPVIPLIAIGGLYLGYRAVQAARTPDEQNTVELNVSDDGRNN